MQSRRWVLQSERSAGGRRCIYPNPILKPFSFPETARESIGPCLGSVSGRITPSGGIADRWWRKRDSVRCMCMGSIAQWWIRQVDRDETGGAAKANGANWIGGWAISEANCEVFGWGEGLCEVGRS